MMMKIHTTQNLNSLRGIESTNKDIPSDEIRLNYSEHMRKQKNAHSITYDSTSFKGKKEIVKKVAKVADKEKWYDKLLKSDFFDSFLDIMSHEVLIQALISGIVCVAMRPLTILAIPTKKNKQDNIYASAHSISSGIVGILASFIIATPFSKGIKFAQKNYLKDLGENLLKRKYPNIDLNSIWADAKHSVRKPVDEWKDIYGNKFVNEYKNVRKVARPKPISEVSEETLKSFNVNVDMNAMKGKSVNDWVDRNGNKVKFDLKDMFIAVKEEGMGGSIAGYKDTNFFSLQHIDKDFLKEVMPQLDIKSIEKDGQRLHTDFWKNVDGTPFKLDMDMIHLSSYRETSSATPLYTGAKRVETGKNGKTKEKYLSYQNNVGEASSSKIPTKHGSPVTQDCLAADKTNTISNKIFAWLPDIVTRMPIAAGTIFLIPYVLKNVFHLEKSKKPDNKAKEQEVVNQNNEAAMQPAFKGKKESAFSKWISKMYGSTYGKKVYNSEKIQTLSEKLSKVPGSMTEHMATLGSVLTSGTYMYQTVNNKDLDPEKRKTLAINQGFCCIVPAIGAYTVSNKLVGFKKDIEYRYCGFKEQQVALGKLSPEKAAKLKNTFGEKLKGLNALTSLLTFTLIYRYITPVVFTPIANKVGNWLNEKNKQEAEKEATKAA